MAYFLDLFTPETWHAFGESGAEVTGFRPRQRRIANERVKEGDIFLCYLTRVSRWCGVLRVASEAFEDTKPIFSDPDPFTIRFGVKPIVVLEPEYSIPIRDNIIWSSLSITRLYDKTGSSWTGFFRGSLNKFNDDDGQFILNTLKKQREQRILQPLSEREKRLLSVQKVPTLGGLVEVEIPDDDADDISTLTPLPSTTREESLRMQAKVAQIGADMGFRIWLPRNDKVHVQQYVPSDAHKSILDILPLNYDDKTLRTIEQIDVLWLKGRSIARAFEIEHTTAIYSGLLRIADLLALQPNMNIRLHIVAPEQRRSQVLREIKRPVFSLLDRGPLYEQCTYLSYESVAELKKMPNLHHIRDSIIDEYEESAEV